MKLAHGATAPQLLLPPPPLQQPQEGGSLRKGLRIKCSVPVELSAVGSHRLLSPNTPALTHRWD